MTKKLESYSIAIVYIVCDQTNRHIKLYMSIKFTRPMHINLLPAIETQKLILCQTVIEIIICANQHKPN